MDKNVPGKQKSTYGDKNCGLNGGVCWTTRPAKNIILAITKDTLPRSLLDKLEFHMIFSGNLRNSKIPEISLFCRFLKIQGQFHHIAS